jgi:hypothetical protein
MSELPKKREGELVIRHQNNEYTLCYKISNAWVRTACMLPIFVLGTKYQPCLCFHDSLKQRVIYIYRYIYFIIIKGK